MPLCCLMKEIIFSTGKCITVIFQQIKDILTGNNFLKDVR